MINVYPLNDLKPHVMESVCECIPKIKEESGELIIIHNSFDGREGLEMVNQILNK